MSRIMKKIAIYGKGGIGKSSIAANITAALARSGKKDKSNTFADFKAVRDGNVWQVGKSMYQATDTVGQFITDVHLMLTGGDESKMTFLSRVAS